jgi:aspartate-semialdehyde dehydrogenase
MSPPLLRVAVVGATGALGGELLDQLRERRFPIQELRPIATDRSLGETVEWLGHELPVVTEVEAVTGLDLVFLCTPPAAALDWIRRSLHAGVACVDFSGALATRAEVPLLAECAASDPAVLAAPLVSVPAAPALALARVLAPLRETAGLVRFVATICDSASGAGRLGVDALQSETLALFNQEEPPDTGLGHALAFDCLPASGPLDEAGAAEAECRVSRELGRLLGAELPHALTVLRVPIFAGMGIQLSLETERELAPELAAERLAKTPGLSPWPPGDGPSTRDAIGEDSVLVGRVRRDASAPHGLSLWLALDPVRLVSAFALRVAEARFRSAV